MSKAWAVCYVSYEGDVDRGELTPHQLCFTQEKDSSSSHLSIGIWGGWCPTVLERPLLCKPFRGCKLYIPKICFGSFCLSALQCLPRISVTLRLSKRRLMMIIMIKIQLIDSNCWTFSGFLLLVWQSKFPVDQSPQMTSIYFGHNI